MTTSFSSTPRCPVVHGQAFDPLDHDQTACPWPWLEAAREQSPIFYLEEFDVWCVTRYEDVMDVVRDTRTFSSMNANEMRDLTPRLREVYPRGHPSVHSLLKKDPPDHVRMRRLVNKAVTPKRVAMLEPEVRKRCEELVDSFAAAGHCDLLADFSARLPVRVISDMLGVPRELEDDFGRWGIDFFTLLKGATPMTPAEEDVHVARAAKVMAWLRAYIDERRVVDHGDLISDLIRATGEDGEPALSDDEILGVANSFLVAGVDTTIIFIPLLIRELLREHSRWEAVASDPSLIPNAVDETLRFWPPARSGRRRALRDATIGGVLIPSGSDVQLFWVSANHDAEMFMQPENFDLRRSNANKHLGFGHGIHMCLGAPLARLEAVVAVETLVSRLPQLRLVDNNAEDWTPNLTIPRLNSLAVEWS